MRRAFVFPAFFTLLAPAAAGERVVVAITNHTGTEKPGETVVVPWSSLPGIPSLPRVTDLNRGTEVPAQALDEDGDGKPDALVFQVDLAAPRTRANGAMSHSTIVSTSADLTMGEPERMFLLEPTATPPAGGEKKVRARHVPERKDDFAWENDRVAFRAYGKALEPELVSSGLDVWAKRTRALVMDRWYQKGEDYYHKDTGEGLDFYSVKQSRGCGGTGIWDGKALHVSKNYKAHRVIAEGPLRAVFELTYEPWAVGDKRVSEVKRITIDAGDNFYEVESRFEVEGGGEITPAVGVAIHPELAGQVDVDRAAGWLSRWESSPENGGLGCALVVDPADLVDVTEAGGNHLLLLKAKPGRALRYRVGSGWDRSGDFADRAAWTAHVRRTAESVRQTPKVVTYRPSSLALPGQGRCWAKVIADSFLAAYPDPRDFDIAKPGRWDYTAGFFLDGLLELHELSPDPRYLAYAKAWVDLFVDAKGTVSATAYDRSGHALDDVLPGRVLLALYRATGEERYRKAAGQISTELATQPRTKEGGFWHKLMYPHQMWLDGLYMGQPFAVEYGSVAGKGELFDDAARQFELSYRHTIDAKTGLLRHGWDESKQMGWADRKSGVSPEIWGRAMGWYLMAIVDCLDYLPADHPKRPWLISTLASLSKSLERYQDPATGMWYQILDKGDAPGNWHETSATAMFAYAMAKGARKGYLPKEARGVAEKAYAGLLEHHVYLSEQKRLAFTGTVKVGTLNASVSKGDYDYYVTTERRLNDLKGVAALLFASLEIDPCGSRRESRR